jgi:hypothetical protein
VKKTSKRTAGSRKRSSGPTAEILTAIASVAKRRKLRWYLFGAQAVAVHGVPRTTADVDVTVELPAAGRQGFVRAMATAGLRVRVPDEERFVATTRVIPFEHVASGWPVDVVLAGPGLEQLFLDNARPLSAGGVTVPVIAAEDLIVLKVLAGRPKDLEDVRGLLRLGTRDLTRCRELLADLERALDQRDLRPRLEALVREVTRR